ncbi:hypothetical protein Vretifemale_17275 [Volvox reticuliferus]|uniref:Uncharacterized protein n=1 Tax=Volvox reticuliferus TaxID=1737510 RepID=A0A8J4CXA4_9CHLO|nr:hypothetical protein Vretifemale_17275 [Volvox reticuliferus]
MEAFCDYPSNRAHFRSSASVTAISLAAIRNMLIFLVASAWLTTRFWVARLRVNLALATFRVYTSVFSFHSILGASSSFAGYEPQMEALKLLGASQGKVDNQQADLDTVVAIDGAGEVRWDETGTEDVEVDEEEDSTSLDVADDAEMARRRRIPVLRQ